MIIKVFIFSSLYYKILSIIPEEHISRMEGGVDTTMTNSAKFKTCNFAVYIFFITTHIPWGDIVKDIKNVSSIFS